MHVAHRSNCATRRTIITMSHDPARAPNHDDSVIVAGEDGGRHASSPRPRTATSTVTSTAEIDSAISHPGSVRINVKGAFIVDGTEQPTTPANGYTNTNGSYHEGKDIRLPYHTAVVSHIAVDVSVAPYTDTQIREIREASSNRREKKKTLMRTLFLSLRSVVP